MTATVVNVRFTDSWTIYIGRANKFRRLPASKWANPFRIGLDGTREEVLAKYEHYVRNRSDLMTAISELDGQILGCWCWPDPCHGGVFVRLLEEIACPVGRRS